MLVKEVLSLIYSNPNKFIKELESNYWRN